MVNQDILGGLKSALARGYSLEEAMFSFLNGGYKKEEVEEAAQSLQIQVAQTPSSSDWLPQPIWARQKGIQAPLMAQKSKLAVPAAKAQPKQVVTRGVAAYTSQDGSKIRTVTIILVILLVVLVGILGLMYIFRDQIIDFFNSLFG